MTSYLKCSEGTKALSHSPISAAQAKPQSALAAILTQTAMVSIAFNLGLTRLLKFEKALGFMAGGDYIMAGMEFDNSLWSKQVGARAEELCQMIETGEYEDASA